MAFICPSAGNGNKDVKILEVWFVSCCEFLGAGTIFAKPFSNSKTISLYITYKNKLFKNQNWLKTEFWKIDKLTEMKNSSNDGVMRKNPLQVTLKSFANQKNLSNHRVVIRKNPLQITSDHFRMTTLSFDEFFNHLSIYHCIPSQTSYLIKFNFCGLQLIQRSKNV